MAKTNLTLSRKTLSELADVIADDVGNDLRLLDNMENILADFEALGDLLSSFDRDANSGETVRHIGLQMERRANGAKLLLEEWHETKRQRNLELIPGGAS